MASLTVGVLTLYGFKLRLFLSPIRRRPATAAVVVVVAITFLPMGFFVGYFFAEFPFLRGNLVETFAFPLSAFVAVSFLAAPGGGMLLQPPEVDFVAVAPVSVRRFALADALFQTTVFGLSLPVITAFSLGFTLRSGTPLWGFLVPVATFALGLFLLTLFIQAMGIARLLGKRWALPLAGILFGVLLAPAAARIVFHLPIAYASLPYPTTAAVQVALLPFGLGDWIGLPVLAAFGAVAVLAHEWAVRHPTLPNLRGTFALAFTPEAKRSQQEALLRLVGRFRRGESSRIYRETTIGTAAALHTVRMTRDGTLFVSAIFAVALSLPAMASGGAFSFGGLYVVLFLPVAAAGQWMITDRPNLWILAVSGASPENYFLGWWAAMAGFVGAVGSVVGILAAVSGAGGIGAALGATIAGTLGGTAGAVAAAARFPYAPSEFSVRPLVHFLLTGLLGGLGAGPIIVLEILGVAPLVFVPLAVATLLGVGVLAYALVRAAGRAPVL